MADEKDQGDKTEEATQTRREEFRKRGQVAQTKELATVFLLFASAISLWLLSRFFLQQILQVFEFSFGDDMVAAVREGTIYPALVFSATKAGLMLSPVLLLVAVIGLSSSVFQVGILQVEDALTPKLDKINPLEGIKRLVSMRQLVEGIKSLAKVILILGVSFFILRQEILIIPHLAKFSIEQIFSYMGTISVKLLFGVGILMAIIAVADYAFQRFDIEKKMRMSKQEVKEEHKTREGDPMIKARIRRVQREMANRRMMDAVPKADVVITNPTHIAVVLKYDGNMPSPQLVAKGADRIAERIKEIARENNVPVIENKPLARTIFKTLKIGHYIPRELFVAVAEVLSYVYRLKRKKRFN